MNQNDKYIFVGNRAYVLEAMLKLGLNVVKIYAIKNSFLSRWLDEQHIEYEYVENKQQLINDLKESEYNVLVSNGCPYILPITELQNTLSDKGIESKFVNIHPSLLPDCKGKHPINAAILFNRKHGVTCHYMDDGIDSGTVIAQLEIPIEENMPLELLYKLSFMAEGDVFVKAYEADFVPQSVKQIENPIYYSRSDEDLYLKNDDSLEMICNRIRAFSGPGMYARIKLEDEEIKIKGFKNIDNEFINWKYKNCDDNSVCMNTANSILCKIHGRYLLLEIADVDELGINLEELCDRKLF